ncbi:RICIN domain-containing protein [Streptomyces sp. NPDC054786]
MSDSQQENVKRRFRARIVDALTTTSRQPGEHSRTAVKIAGAIAVLALVAGGALGLGAWRSYHDSGHSKNVADSSKKPSRSPSASGSASPSPSGGDDDSSHSTGGQDGSPSSEDGGRGGKKAGGTAAKGPVTSLLPDLSKKGRPKKASPKSAKAAHQDLSHILMQNAATRRCAAPLRGKDKTINAVEQFGCRKSGDSNQVWNMNVIQNRKNRGGHDLITIRNVKSGECLDLPGTKSVSSEAVVQQGYCDTSGPGNQLWWIDPTKDGKLLIRNYASNSACLQIGKVRTADKVGLPLHVGSCAVGQKNRWLFADG